MLYQQVDETRIRTQFSRYYDASPADFVRDQQEVETLIDLILKGHGLERTPMMFPWRETNVWKQPLSHSVDVIITSITFVRKSDRRE